MRALELIESGHTSWLVRKRLDGRIPKIMVAANHHRRNFYVLTEMSQSLPEADLTAGDQVSSQNYGTYALLLDCLGYLFPELGMDPVSLITYSVMSV